VINVVIIIDIICASYMIGFFTLLFLLPLEAMAVLFSSDFFPSHSMFYHELMILHEDVLYFGAS